MNVNDISRKTACLAIKYCNKIFKKDNPPGIRLSRTPLKDDPKCKGYYDEQVKASMTPYILEEREMRVTQMDIFSRLMRERLLWVAGPVNDRMSTVVQAQLMYLDSADNLDITMHIDSPGGSVKSGLSMVDVMDYIKCDIRTVNTGMAASMGSVLLGAGTKGKRSSLRFSKTMLHQTSGGAGGNIQDARINFKEWEKNQQNLIRTFRWFLW